MSLVIVTPPLPKPLMAKAACGCGKVGEGNGGWSPVGGHKWLHTLLHGMELCIGGHLCWECVGAEGLKPRMGAARLEREMHEVQVRTRVETTKTPTQVQDFAELYSKFDKISMEKASVGKGNSVDEISGISAATCASKVGDAKGRNMDETKDDRGVDMKMRSLSVAKHTDQVSPNAQVHAGTPKPRLKKGGGLSLASGTKAERG
ncbi:hypothetical protein EDB86DRAFT_2833441 [Lactarius hatsudake]|nr:hypothetical protein EDB86DRAFT_2833441 [Lactarius hatsudake]